MKLSIIVPIGHKDQNFKLFDQLKVPIQHAGDSQGILHLFKNYCQKNQYISCNVGFHLMKL